MVEDDQDTLEEIFRGASICFQMVGMRRISRSKMSFRYRFVQSIILLFSVLSYIFTFLFTVQKIIGFMDRGIPIKWIYVFLRFSFCLAYTPNLVVPFIIFK